MKRGMIFWGLVDKRRPVLLVSPTVRNERATDVLAVPISTTIKAGSWHVMLARGEAGLPRASMAKCEAVGRLEKELIEPQPVGLLSEARMLDIERALMLALGIESP